LRDFRRLARILADVYGPPTPESREVRRILAIQRLLSGESANDVASKFGLQKRALVVAAERVRAEGLSGLTAYSGRITEQDLARRRNGIAQMVLGLLAERRFEELSNEITGTGTLRIEDHRLSRTDTDYRLLNGQSNPICRLNIKFHGTLFRESQRFVGLAPEDCFALATYKINNALKRQKAERLPYVFLVLSVRDVSAADVARVVSDDYVWALSALEGRMAIEEAIVKRLLVPDDLGRFRPILDRMPEGQFRIISAQKAYNILKEPLFERVHALSLKGFTRRFSRAEVDMHLSLSQELTPVRTFLELLVRESPQKFAVRLYIGDY
jgi:hypothetical protein